MTSRPSPPETILDLPVEDIAAADYRSVSDVNCIYVETVQDPEGYTQRYWVSVETGLLVASERLLEETIYRMASLTDLSTPSTDRFICRTAQCCWTHEANPTGAAGGVLFSKAPAGIPPGPF